MHDQYVFVKECPQDLKDLRDLQGPYDLQDQPLRCAGPRKLLARFLTRILTRISGPGQQDGPDGADEKRVLQFYLESLGSPGSP